jgi:hypothetical protein
MTGIIQESKMCQCAVIIGGGLIYEVSFDYKDSPGMALRALASFRQYHEFEANEIQRKKIINLSILKKWGELYSYLVEEGIINIRFKRCG